MAVNNDPRDGLNWIAWSQLEERYSRLLTWWDAAEQICSMGESTRASFYSKRGAELQARQQIRQGEQMLLQLDTSDGKTRSAGRLKETSDAAVEWSMIACGLCYTHDAFDD
eukprot:758820-Hanusia_phi.AAC.1